MKKHLKPWLIITSVILSSTISSYSQENRYENPIDENSIQIYDKWSKETGIKLDKNPVINSEEIIAQIKTRIGTDSTPTLNLNRPTLLEEIGKSQPIRLTDYNIGGSDDFSVDKYGNITIKSDNDLMNYVILGFGIVAIVLGIYLINRTKSKTRRAKGKEENEKFKIGDVVKLIGGSPDMTVEEISISSSREQVLCSWFDNGKLQKAKLHQDSLILKVNFPSED